MLLGQALFPRRPRRSSWSAGFYLSESLTKHTLKPKDHILLVSGPTTEGLRGKMNNSFSVDIGFPFLTNQILLSITERRRFCEVKLQNHLGGRTIDMLPARTSGGRKSPIMVQSTLGALTRNLWFPVTRAGSGPSKQIGGNRPRPGRGSHRCPGGKRPRACQLRTSRSIDLLLLSTHIVWLNFTRFPLSPQWAIRIAPAGQKGRSRRRKRRPA